MTDFKVLCTVFTLCYAGAAASASDWTGANSSDWFDPSNWYQGEVPGQDDPVRINILSAAQTSVPAILQGLGMDETSAYGQYLQMTKGGELSIADATLYITATGDRTRIGTGGVEGQTSRVVIGNGGRIKFTDSSANADFIVGHTLSGVRGSGYLEVQSGGVLDLGSNGQLMVGETGDGIAKFDGGSLIAKSMQLGNRVNGNGVAQFGGGARADISGNVILAGNSNADASLSVDAGEISIGGTLYLGNAPTSLATGANSASVTLSNGAVMNVAGQLRIGYNLIDSAAFTMNGGTLTVGSVIYIGHSATANSSLFKLGGESTVKADTIIVGNAGAGVMEIASDGVSLLGKDGNGLSAISSYSGGGTLKFTHDGLLDLQNKIQGNNLKVEHSGAGTTALTSSNSYRGGTALSGGTLVAGNSNAFGTGGMEISGGTLLSEVSSLNIGELSMSSGALNLHDSIATSLSVAGFSMTGGLLSLDIFSTGSFDKFASSGGALDLSAGEIILYGFSGFEGPGNVYYIFSGFTSQNIGGIIIKGYDTENYDWRINSNGGLYFVTSNPITNDWLGTASNDWFDDANWKGGRAPGEYGDTVRINSGATPTRYLSVMAGSVENVARSTIAHLFVGQNASLQIENAILTLNGSSSSYSRIGSSAGAQAQLTIKDGGKLVSDKSLAAYSMYIGHAAGSDGYVLVEDGGEIDFGENGRIDVGFAGTGLMDIAGTVSSKTMNVGSSTNGVGTVNVKSTGELNVSGNLIVAGNAADGSFNMDGGRANLGALIVGNNAAMRSAVAHISNNAELNITGGLIVGVATAANGGVFTSDGSRVQAGSMTLRNGSASFLNGSTVGIDGTATIGSAGGPASSLTVDNSVFDAQYLRILSGGASFSGGAVSNLGYFQIAGGSSMTVENATVYVDDTAATPDRTRIGTSEGDALLTIKNGGVIKFAENTKSGDFVIGHTAGHTGRVVVEKGGSLLLYTGGTDEHGEVKVGNNGIGVLDVYGVVESSYGRIGNQTGGDGTVTVYDGGTWTMTQDLYIANRAGTKGLLTIESGGAVSVGTFASIGEKYSNGGAEVVVNGGSFIGGENSTLYVGRGGNGDLAVNSGMVSFGDILVGNRNLFYGSGSGNVYLKGGEVVADNSFVVGNTSGAGYVKVENDAVITADTITVGKGSSGVLDVATNNGTFRGFSLGGLTNIAGGSSSGTVRFSYDSGALDFSNVISGSYLKVEHVTAGTTTIAGNNSYGGGTAVTNGTVVAGHSNALGTGLLSITGGRVQAGVENLDISGGVSIESGVFDMHDSFVNSVSVSDFSMSGGSYTLDIFDLDSFDAIISSGGILDLSGGTIVLSGFEGFEGVLGSHGNKYHIFQNFSQLAALGVTIAGYDAENWTAVINDSGELVFTAIPEPAAIAILLGFLALGLIAGRRK